MKTSPTPPPIYARLHKEFGVEWDKGIIITYGDTIYCKFALTPDLVVHEQTHIDQQKSWGDPDSWWEKYINNKNFRFDQEVPAYQNQMKYLRETCKSREELFHTKLRLANDLSGPIYGNLCTLADAKRLLN